MEKQKDEMETKKDKNSEQERVEENKETLISTHIFILPFKKNILSLQKLSNYYYNK